MSTLVCACILLAPAIVRAVFTRQSSAQTETQAQPQNPPDPTLVHRPPANQPKPASAITPEGRIHLDVTVTDAAGKAVTGLQPWDFTLLDNSQPRKILSFRSFDGVAVKPDPPVQAILLIDTSNLPFQQVAFVRSELRKFLLENGGHLSQPVSLFLLSDTALRVQPRPSADGNALVGVLDQIKGSVRTIDTAASGEGLLERFQLSIRQMTTIAENEAQMPDRKLLIWVGPGWPILNSANFRMGDKDQRRYFDSIVELSTKLREARMVVYSVSPADSTSTGAYTFTYQSFLKGVKSAKQADNGNLALKVLAIESGGRILGPDNNLAGQIDSCIADASAFYTLSFDPPHADRADEYHELNLQIDKPGMIARTSSGYYNQP
ncbi:MAG: VWA domain-containing protein [Terracidiphilus sp.]